MLKGSCLWIVLEAGLCWMSRCVIWQQGFLQPLPYTEGCIFACNFKYDVSGKVFLHSPFIMNYNDSDALYIRQTWPWLLLDFGTWNNNARLNLELFDLEMSFRQLLFRGNYERAFDKVLLCEVTLFSFFQSLTCSCCSRDGPTKSTSDFAFARSFAASQISPGALQTLLKGFDHVVAASPSRMT